MSTIPDSVLAEMTEARETARRHRIVQLASLSASNLLAAASNNKLSLDPSLTLFQQIGLIVDAEFPDLMAMPGLHHDGNFPPNHGGSVFINENGTETHRVQAQPPTDEYRDMAPVSYSGFVRAADLATELSGILVDLNNGEANIAHKRLADLMDAYEMNLPKLNFDEINGRPMIPIEHVRRNLHECLMHLLSPDTLGNLFQLATLDQSKFTSSELDEEYDAWNGNLTNILDAEYVERHIRQFMKGHWSEASIDAVVQAAMHIPNLKSESVDAQPTTEEVAPVSAPIGAAMMASQNVPSQPRPDETGVLDNKSWLVQTPASRPQAPSETAIMTGPTTSTPWLQPSRPVERVVTEATRLNPIVVRDNLGEAAPPRPIKDNPQA